MRPLAPMTVTFTVRPPSVVAAADSRVGLPDYVARRTRGWAYGLFGRGYLQAEIGQAGMICWARTAAVPEELAVAFLNRNIVDAGVTVSHQTGLVEQPVLVAVCTEPLTGVGVVLIGETYSD